MTRKPHPRTPPGLRWHKSKCRKCGRLYMDAIGSTTALIEDARDGLLCIGVCDYCYGLSRGLAARDEYIKWRKARLGDPPPMGG